MNIGYWIRDGKWRLVDEDSYEKFNGKKCMCPRDRSPVWFWVTGLLLQFR